ncbi:Hypothetical predicted protein [Octopus vulgaris]|nr:Hypothetical predicted protein [Octopus vulgaris]
MADFRRSMGDVLGAAARPQSPLKQRRGKKKSEERYISKLDKQADEEAFTFPKEHENIKVQESDGNFFESFTALSWRQENKRLRATSELDLATLQNTMSSVDDRGFNSGYSRIPRFMLYEFIREH